MILELPTYLMKVSRYSDFSETVFNTTLFLQNATQPLYNCTFTTEQLYDF